MLLIHDTDSSLSMIMVNWCIINVQWLSVLFIQATFYTPEN